MACPSEIYTVLTNYQIATDAQGPFGSVVRRYGPALRLDGQSVNAYGSGYYEIDASLSFTPTATGPVTIQFYQDGVAIPGALGTAQGTAAEPVNISVVGLMRNCGCDCNSAITYTVDAAGLIANLAVRIDR